MKKLFIPLLSFFSIFAALSANAQKVTLEYKGGNGYSLVERTNLRRYENGKYIGLTSREVHSFISPASPMNAAGSNSRWYDGNFYVIEDTLKNRKETSLGILDTVPSTFYISPEGRMTMFEDNGYPSFRSFPAYATQPVQKGDSWTGEAIRCVDPLNKGIFTKLKILVRYTFDGEEMYNGEPVYRIKAIWQTNYGRLYRDFGGDVDLQKAAGGHKADIIVQKSTGQTLMVLDVVDETFVYSDGKQINFKGTITLFTEFPPAINREQLLPVLQQIATVTPEAARGKPKSLGGSSGAISTVEKPSSMETEDKNPVQTDSKSGTMGGTESNAETLNGGVSSNKGSGGIDSVGAGSGVAKAGGANISDANGTGKSGNVPDGTGGNGSNQSGVGSEGTLNNGTGTNGAVKGKNSEIEKNAVAWEPVPADSSYFDNPLDKPSTAGSEKLAKATETESGVRQNPFEGIIATPSGGDNKNGELVAIAEEPAKNNMVVEQTTAGLRLSVRNLQFMADSSDVLPSEKSRLDEIAGVLKMVPGSKFLVEGYSASVGNPKGEQSLSEQRAKKIALELSKRGVPVEDFICRGRGSANPVASNATSEGKALNRRVEITILE